MTVVELVAGPPIRDVPEVRDYHLATREAAEALPPGTREQLAEFLSTMADNAARQTRTMLSGRAGTTTSR